MLSLLTNPLTDLSVFSEYSVVPFSVTFDMLLNELADNSYDSEVVFGYGKSITSLLTTPLSSTRSSVST